MVRGDRCWRDRPGTEKFTLSGEIVAISIGLEESPTGGGGRRVLLKDCDGGA